MRLGDKKIFQDKQKLYSLVNLRINGYAHTSLAVIFSCDISSIRAQCDKYGIIPQGEVYTIERLVKDILPQFAPLETKWRVIDGKRYALGKTYEEYFEQQYPHKNIRSFTL